MYLPKRQYSCGAFQRGVCTTDHFLQLDFDEKLNSYRLVLPEQSTCVLCAVVYVMWPSCHTSGVSMPCVSLFLFWLVRFGKMAIETTNVVCVFLYLLLRNGRPEPYTAVPHFCIFVFDRLLPSAYNRRPLIWKRNIREQQMESKRKSPGPSLGVDEKKSILSHCGVAVVVVVVLCMLPTLSDLESQERVIRARRVTYSRTCDLLVPLNWNNL